MKALKKDLSRAGLLGFASSLSRILRIRAGLEFAEGQRLADLRLSSVEIDSLLAAELRNRVGAWAGTDVPPHSINRDGRLRHVVEHIHQLALTRSPAESDAINAEQVAAYAEVMAL